MPQNCHIDSSHEDLQKQPASVQHNSLKHYLEAYMEEEDMQDESPSNELSHTHLADNLGLNVLPPVNMGPSASPCSTTSSPPPRPHIMTPSPTKVPIIASSSSKTDVRADVPSLASPRTPNGSPRRPKTPGIKWPLSLYVRPPFSPKSPSLHSSPPSQQPTSEAVVRPMLKRSCVPYDVSHPDRLRQAACELVDTLHPETMGLMTPPPTPGPSSQRFTLRPPEKLKRARNDVEEMEQQPRTKRRLTNSRNKMPPPPVPERSPSPSSLHPCDFDMDREDTPEPEMLTKPATIAPAPIKYLSVRRPIPVFYDE
ncbi:hypothetical protein BDZ89DRAFT_1163956 [Hymenopellis radicata]|nr:hypothetical protein BDZ89DRAFT_1163956 [Hymenopellis radicata]